MSVFDEVPSFRSKGLLGPSLRPQGWIEFDIKRMDMPMPMRQRDLRVSELRICGCGDPGCGYGPPETQDAFRRGMISNADRDQMREMARAMQLPDGQSFVFRSGEAPSAPFRNPFADPPSKPDTATDDDDDEVLEGLREKVQKWIVPAPEQSFDDIIGNDEALSQLRDAIRAPVEEADLYAAYALAMPKGALLSGPPGCGKTMFARAAASEMTKLYGDGVEMISISGSSIQAPYVGVTEGYIKDIFAFARQYHKVNGHPLLVFIDEAEALFPDRTGRVRSVAPWEESNVATFLAEMDGMQASGAFVLLASNRPEVIDNAILRDGRCDFKIKVARPTAEALEGILRKNFAGIFTNETEDDLVFAALESFLDPHRVLLDFHDIIRRMEDWFLARGIEVKDKKTLAQINSLKCQRFTFDMIVNGAMAASVSTRAKRRAFARDRAAKTKIGVTSEDVLCVVADIFEENKGLDQSYALMEFMKGIEAQLKEIGQ